jgi:Glycosyltransferase family 87
MTLFVKKIKPENLFYFLLLSICVFLSVDSAYDGGDFDVYLEAAYKLYHGQNPYLPPYSKDGMGYSYSPFFIMLLIPFTSDYFITELVWCLLSFFFVYRSFIIFSTYFPISFDQVSLKLKYFILITLLSYQFLSNNIGMVQVTPFLMWIIFESIYQIQKWDRNILGGILLGIGINIKILPIVMLGYLFYRGYFKSFSVAIATFMILYFAPTIFWGLDYNLTLLKDWWVIINPTSAEHQVETGIGTHSMVAFMPVYLTETVGQLPYKRHIFNFDLDTAIIITNIVNLFLISLSLLYFRSIPFLKERSDRKTMWEICFFLLLIPLIFPHQQKYAFLLVMPMTAYIVYFFFNTWSISLNSKTYKFVFVLFAVSMIVFSPIHGSEIIGKELFRLSQHYRLITMSTLLLIPISLYCSPHKLKSI